MFEPYMLIKSPREISWGQDPMKNFQSAKKEILDILKKQKVSLSETRFLFHCILDEIEDNNAINL